jgi:hypothetical protein
MTRPAAKVLDASEQHVYLNILLIPCKSLSVAQPLDDADPRFTAVEILGQYIV